MNLLPRAIQLCIPARVRACVRVVLAFAVVIPSLCGPHDFLASTTLASIVGGTFVAVALLVVKVLPY